MEARAVRKVATTDRQAIASAAIAVLAVLSSQVWILACIFAIVSIALAVSSRRKLKQGEQLRGSSFGLLGFLVASGVLLIVLGPRLVTIVQFLMAPNV